jgi:hypothetical protein
MTSPRNSPSAELRRRLVPPLVAVTVLAVLIGGGYALRGGQNGAAGDGGGATPTLLRLAGYRPPTAGHPGYNLFHLAGDLPDGPRDAAVRWLTAPDDVAVGRLAKTLGLRGPRTSTDGASIYTTDAASLRVQEGPGGQWQYVSAAFSNGSVACPPLPTPVATVDQPGRTVTCDVAVPVPLPAVARAAARPVLEAVGIDPDSAVVRAGQGAVVDNPMVENLPTNGLTTTVRVIGTRVSSADGYLGGWSAGSTYPVISAPAAWRQLARLPMARPLIGCREPQPAGIDPMICGGPITVTGARFGLSLHEENGRPLLVPSWLFDVGGSDNVLSVVAVDPRYLAQPPIPTAGGSEPGSVGSGSVGSGSVGSGSVGPGGSGGSGSGGSGPLVQSTG